MDNNFTPGDIARRLAQDISSLAAHLLPHGRRENAEWCTGSANSPFGCSVSVHLAGRKAGIWSAWATGRGGDALDLVRAVLNLGMVDALDWSCRWLGIAPGEAPAPLKREELPKQTAEPEFEDPLRWQRPWGAARPIPGTRAEIYLAGRGLRFDDRDGRVLRFAERRPRKSPDGELEHHPALLALLSDALSGEPRGAINIYLEAGGRDRLRDAKGKTITGRAKGAVVMLSAFEEPTAGLVLCEGVETGIAILMTGLAPVWACGGAGTLAKFPILDGVEALTIAADADLPGQKAAAEAAQRWRQADREVAVVSPPAGDWADGRRAA